MRNAGHAGSAQLEGSIVVPCRRQATDDEKEIEEVEFVGGAADLFGGVAPPLV